MKRVPVFRFVSVFVTVCFLACMIGRVEAKPKPAAKPVGVATGDISGVVASSKGPEAGVWVIAETSDLPTGFVKIVVTDDQGRYVLPELPKGNYKVWVRGYGLVDSKQVTGAPGKSLNLTAVIAPTPKDAAQVYPGNYWLSLIHVPDKSEFPMKTSGTALAAGEETAAQSATHVIANQQEWIFDFKVGCQQCHQLGSGITRDLTHLASYHFKSSADAWDHRVQFGQAGTGMSGALDRMNRQRAIQMYSDWTDRIAAGELPPTPPRPQGVERNVVITMWNWGKNQTHVHDIISADKRKVGSNANGLVFGADYSNDTIVSVDPVNNTENTIEIPTIESKATMKTTWPTLIKMPSPFWGDKLIWPAVTGAHSITMDQANRVWVTAAVRSRDDSDFCKGGPDSPYGQYFPLKTSGRQVAVYDQETKKFTPVDTCFGTHHIRFAEDKDNTIYFSGGGPVLGWLNTRVLDQTGDSKKAQGWCPAYLDTKGDGTVDRAVDKRIDVAGYGVIVNPVDGSIWSATPGMPGHITRITIGANPPATCKAEVYEPPFNNPKAPGVYAYTPRGIDVDRNGVIWTALAGSGQLASFDRSKCKVLNGPTATGQQCPEGWTIHTTPGPRMQGVTEDSSADYQYYNWVDQYNSLGLGDNIPLVTGSGSDSIEAYMPSSNKWVVMRVPYPMAFYSKMLDGRIDDPKTGWKGRGVYGTYGQDPIWHMEGGYGSLDKLVKFQIRPNPLAK